MIAFKPSTNDGLCSGHQDRRNGSSAPGRRVKLSCLFTTISEAKDAEELKMSCHATARQCSNRILELPRTTARPLESIPG